jgi:PII-like signaling protein
MRVKRDSVQLTVYVAEPHLHDRRGKVEELLRRTAADGGSGATVLVAYQGFGRRHSHEPTLWHKTDETPLTVIFVDVTERIEHVLTLLDKLLPDVVAVTERIHSVRYTRRTNAQGPI